MFFFRTILLLFLLAVTLPGAAYATEETDIYQLLAEARSSARTGGYPAAMEKLQSALSLAQEKNDRLTQAITLDNMAEIYRLQGNNRQALDRYTQALTIYKEIGHALGISLTEQKIDQLLGRPPKNEQAPPVTTSRPATTALPSETREKLIKNAIDRIRSRVKEQQAQEDAGETPKSEEPQGSTAISKATPPDKTATPGSSDSAKQTEYSAYLKTVKTSIVRAWKYPEEASQGKEEGKVDVEFTILKNGALQDVRILRSSGFSSLDREALRAVGAASPFTPIPTQIGVEQLSIRFTFNYTLAMSGKSP